VTHDRGGSCMQEHVYRASRRRDERLGRIRKLSLWIAGGAAAASLGMGTAFAHAIPGHTVTTGGGTPATGTAGVAPATSSSAASSSAGGTTGTTTQQGSSGSAGRHHRHRLAPPASAPATPKATPKPAPAAPPAPVVSSGGS
jgi:hypothetical protein